MRQPTDTSPVFVWQNLFIKRLLFTAHLDLSTSSKWRKLTLIWQRVPFWLHFLEMALYSRLTSRALMSFPAVMPGPDTAWKQGCRSAHAVAMNNPDCPHRLLVTFGKRKRKKKVIDYVKPPPPHLVQVSNAVRFVKLLQ